MAPPPTSGIASALDGGKGRLKEAVEAVRDCGAGALHTAAGRGRTPMCAYLVEELGMDVNAADDKGATPLTYALRWRAVDTVRYLFDHGADPEKPGEQGLCEMIEVLLSKGADVNCFSYRGTLLHSAIIGKQDAAVKLLLDHHADCNKPVSLHYTPLIAALHARSLKCVKLLIEQLIAGADAKGVPPLTPLIVAANDGLTDFYEPLLRAGADPDVRDDGGQLPIEIAARKNRRKDVEILFPVTSHIPYVRDWSVDGILAYVKSVPKEEDDLLYKMGPAYLKLEGTKAYKRKDCVSAINFYSMAIKLNPGDVTLHSNKSLCWINLGEGDKALEDAEFCRMIRPDWPKACYRQGAAQMLLKNYEKACEAFQDGLKLDPTNVEIENALRLLSNHVYYCICNY
ncbi:transient receptor potential channel pyrexia-like [Triticum dicoccoides]|uniref:transient receptor potential channel pyrexia-like n=1 Tax=Triticum dicoccoides TaxID=85692 RepID=UPI0018912C7B|nr:transient receptor potential channel pyrexia-like [Triticum dicoccoides]